LTPSFLSPPNEKFETLLVIGFAHDLESEFVWAFKEQHGLCPEIKTARRDLAISAGEVFFAGS